MNARLTPFRVIPFGMTATLLLAAAIPGCAGCGSTSLDTGRDDQLAGRLIVTGSSTVAPLVAEIGRRFESLHPATRIDVQTGGSSRGIADVRRGIAAIGMVSRSLRPAESDLESHLIAIDGICIILHRDNPVSGLTRDQVIAIYTGRLTDWAAAGGAASPITVVNKADGRSTLELFLSHFQLAVEEIRPSVVIGDNQQGILTVAGDPNAIAYVSIGSAQSEAARGTPIKLLPLEDVPPTLDNVRNGTFPLARPLNLVTSGDLSPLVEAFVGFASSRAVRDLVEAQYFVPAAD